MNGVFSGGPQEILDNVRKAVAPKPGIVKPTSIVAAATALADYPASNLWDKSADQRVAGHRRACRRSP